MGGGGFTSVAGAGAMLNWITIADGDREVFEDWYNFEHLPERVEIPGFRRARRYVAPGGSRDGHTDFLTIYETDDVEVLASPAYLRALDAPTELTRRVVPLFTRFRRSTCRITVAHGAGSTGRCVAVELAPERLDAVRDELAGTVLPAMRAAHLLHAASVYEPDAAVGAAKAATSEGKATTQQQAAQSALLLLEPQPEVPAARLLAELGQVLGDASTPPTAREFTLLFELRRAP
ncbi:hypothetical protein OOZ19_03485 [Saccharopolyspora sp. NFXS83]|uniref:DUF4286 family protein n=1 Tax=Saccharopolyspora sp. NFXS83 TaxID=2993560 RepID=UPI00224A9E0F|nr:DUF4286 family protein [Saccharopolyspora sp. NFXS83]MCX2729290.1 hypothetical protein [Saccharopolyspora sp. NFXS83]